MKELGSQCLTLSSERQIIFGLLCNLCPGNRKARCAQEECLERGVFSPPPSLPTANLPGAWSRNARLSPETPSRSAMTSPFHRALSTIARQFKACSVSLAILASLGQKVGDLTL